MSMIPEEIISALESKNFTLLVKGPPGSGKTTFVLTLAKKFIGKVIYLSSRVNVDELLRQFPWIKELLEKKAIYETTISRIPKKQSEYRIHYSNITEFMRRVYDIVESLSQEGVILIIDSVDAIKEFFNLSFESYQLEMSLMDIVDTYGFNLILVSEVSEISKLDFLSDGVISLDREFRNGAILRVMRIEKLRGQEITNPEYYFTLLDKGFTIIPKVRSEFASFKNPPKFEVFKEDHFSASFFSQIIGNFNKRKMKIPLGSSILLEIAPETPHTYYTLFSDLFGINMMRQGYPWYCLSSIVYDIDLFYKQLESGLDIDISDKFIGVAPKRLRALRENISKRKYKLLELSEEPNEMLSSFIKLFEQKPPRTFYMSVFIDLLTSTYPVSDILNLVEQLTKMVSVYKGLGIFMAFSSFDRINHLRGFFDHHLKMEIVGNIVVVRVLKPTISNYFAVVHNLTEGFPDIKLIPIK